MPAKRIAFEFLRFVGIEDPSELRTVNRPHVIAWRRQMAQRQPKPATVRRKLSALSELFKIEY